jgi:hypothetical protein
MTPSPRIEAIIISLHGNLTVTKFKEHGEGCLHFCARSYHSKVHGEDPGSTGFDGNSVISSNFGDDLELLTLKKL